MMDELNGRYFYGKEMQLCKIKHILKESEKYIRKAN